MLTKLARLTPVDWWGLMVAYLYLCWAGWRIFVRRERLDRWLVERPPLAGPGQLTPSEKAREVRRAGWVNLAANRPIPWARCLQRSLALCLWMERRGYQTQLRIGVRKEDAELLAHAWVVFDGEVLNDDPERLVDFASLETAGETAGETTGENSREFRAEA